MNRYLQISLISIFLPCALIAQQVNSDVTIFTSRDLQILKARLTDKSTGNPLTGIRGYVTVPGKRFQMRTGISDQNGNVFFPMTDMKGIRQRLIFETNNLQDSNCIFTVNKPILQKYPAEPIIEEDEYDQGDTLVFYGKGDKTYLLDDYVRFPTLEEVFREYVPEIRISRIRNEFRFSVLNTPFRTYFDEEPLILLDGVPVFDYKKLMQIDPLKIKKLEVVSRKYYYGSLVCYGIISLFSYEGDLAGYTLHPNALVMDYDGAGVSSK